MADNIYMVRRPFHFIQQPVDSSQCGHACVAMATGQSLETIVKMIGGVGATRTKTLAKVLRRFGISCPSKLTRLTSKEPFPSAHAILRLRYYRKDGTSSHRSHWLLLWDWKLYDPITEDGRPNFDRSPLSKITSFLALSPKETHGQ